MDDDGTSQVGVEKERLLWKARELLLRTKVLQSQLNAAKRSMAASLEISKATSESVKSINHNDKYHLLKLNQEQLIEERQLRSCQLDIALRFAKSQTFRRSKAMIGELWDIYPIIEFPDRKGYSICDIHLPSSEHFEGHDETMVSVAIGYVGHLLLSLSNILDISLRFPLKYYGSKSLIYCSRRNQLFPLYIESFKSREWVNFSYGMNLLNLNIVQLRTLYELPTIDPDDTLANLHGLKQILDNEARQPSEEGT